MDNAMEKELAIHDELARKNPGIRKSGKGSI
jgi:hypothetical protein